MRGYMHDSDTVRRDSHADVAHYGSDPDFDPNFGGAARRHQTNVGSR
jgi:hypothetical protein